MPTDDLVNRRFGRLIAIGCAGRRPSGKVLWMCRCDCGNTTVVHAGNLKSGHTASCGCLVLRHGHARPGRNSPTYQSWKAMWDRCTLTAHPAFHRYGGRGIGVCQRWNSFQNFLADMGERQAATTLDRIDNDRGYEPGNCRWATNGQQNRNRPDNRWLTLDGLTLTITDWARRTGILSTTIRMRLVYGWSVERALRTPTGRRKLSSGALLAKAARHLGLRPATVRQRIDRDGWSEAQALSIPAGGHP